MVHRMQEILYEQCPVIPFGYGKDLDVYNTADWEGWVKMPGGTGSVANMWNYLNVSPKTATEASTGMGTGVIIGIVAAVVIVAGVVVLVLRQRKPRQMEE